jgi:ribosomal protein S18 acetylase RimI-like enzyme
MFFILISDPMSNEIIARRPSECSKRELEAFVTVAAKGEEVESRDIERGANRAATLLWINGDDGPFAVAAVKTPFDSYKKRVFQKAGVPTEFNKLTLELGYIYVEEAQRHNGHGPALVQKAVGLYGKQGIYATTRADNARM